MWVEYNVWDLLIISIRHLGVNSWANRLDGPLPIDLPTNITFSFLYPNPPSYLDFIMCLKTDIAHDFISLLLHYIFFCFSI